ncbi:AAA family ATPase [Corynebacterium sp. zg-331]|uniref:AAA family ATPase n=1 Tax=unclassified Corynebacterium TaxID=2624378 RepID=UPI00128C2BE8|nr:MULTISPECIES: AAA family ATPase [unclassified Corynebacterium]MBC3186181.1 AAA family ATPase [Corynebacterium sp. zg-331]MPV52669.1 AAA family ATPase [Corynebacterium sp. zg331]
MKIRSLVVDHFRGIEHLELRGVPERGVVVISGDNEQGKSTLMEAVRAVLQERHSARNKKVKAWQPVGTDEAPQVSLTATIGPYEVEIDKRWLRRPACTLRVRGEATDNLSGREADDRIERLLAEHTDERLLDVLFMKQGEAAEMAAAAGIPSLTQVLDEHTGHAARDAQADSALVEAAIQEYRRYYTETGRSRGELQAAEKEDEEARDELARVREETQRLAEQVERVENLRRRKEEARAALPEARRAATEAEARHRAAAKATEERERAQKELRDATVLWESAEARCKERRKLDEQCKESSAALREVAARYEETARIAESDKKTLAKATEERDEARERLAEAKHKRAAAAEDLHAARARKRLAELDATLNRVAEIDERLASLGNREVSRAQWQKVEKAYEEVRVAQAVRSATAARLILEGPEEATVFVDGELCSVPGEVKLHEGTRLRMGEVTAVYSRGEDEAAHDPVAAAEEILSRRLARLDCGSLDEARAAAEATEKRALVRAEREGVLHGQDPEELRAEREDMRAFLTGREAVPALAQAEAADKEAAGVLRECDEAENILAQAVEELRTGSAVVDHARAEANKELADQRHADLEARLAQARREATEEDLAQVAREAAARRDSAQVAYERAKAVEEGTDPEHSRRLWQGAVAKCETLSEEVSRTTRELDRLSSHIEAAHGVGERLAQAQAQAQARARRLAAVHRRAEAAATVRGALLRHRDAARSRYAGPFARQLTALGRTVFGRDVEFRLTEELAIGERVLGGRNIAVQDLSGGAQEQVALMTRFAIVELVGDAMPVFIDDALGSTDPERLALMSTLLSRVGEDHQVFVLTCAPQRYAQVVAQRSYRIEDLKSS